ncbi:MAG TPA: sugar ABC transporter permease [Candidatus Limnocylindrales bacterium]|nr:sugar ABC transporter permease [Candidatus Limnocylindrales bacterium]
MTADGGAEANIGPAVTTVPPRGAPARRIAGVAPRRLLVYLPILPALVAFVVLLGYPVVLAVSISFQKMGLRELVQHTTVWIGLDNYRQILTDPTFWTITIRTIGFTAVNVALTMLVGTGVALLLGALNRWLRLALSVALILAWATPALTASVIFQWLFDSKFGVVNWALTSVGIFGDWTNHSWFDTGLSTFFVITLLIVWQAVPFVAFSLRAGILAISADQYEAARVDGASERQIFRRITFPSILPLFMILAFLSSIWDFKVFTQIWTVRQGGPAGETVTLAIYAYLKGITGAQYGLASAIAVVMVLLLLFLLIPYIRRLIRQQEAAAA